MPMRSFALATVATAIAFAIVAYLLPQISYGGSIPALLVLAVIFGVVNGLIGPVIRLLSLPITALTLGLFSLVINGVLLLLTAAVADRFGIQFQIADFPPDLTLDAIVGAVVGGVVLSIVSAVTHRLVPD
jgi:putative membrane protein